MNSSTVISVVVAILVILGLGWWFMTMQPQAAPNVQVNTDVTPGTTPATSTAPMTVTITHTADGFSPTEVTIKKGGTVMWQSSGGTNMWVASAQHPIHSGYDGTSLQQHCTATASTTFDQCKTGTTYSFTFDKAGTWPYHNHSSATQFGSVTVVE